jgi:hypothetical protein
MQTDGLTDRETYMTKLRVTSRNFANVPSKEPADVQVLCWGCRIFIFNTEHCNTCKKENFRVSNII